MNSVLDSKVVEMKFDNRQFEEGVKHSLLSIDRLKNALNFSGIERGFENVGAAVGAVDFDPMASAVEGARSKFSALEVMAVTALANITNSAVNTGKRLIGSLSVDQITAGWSKLEQKTTSVATLVSQGYDLDEVEEQLKRLNWFTDETSYNFTDMVSNIAKFTASGQDLKTSVTAMEGIANWAALSGQNAQTASRAMYQLSQAMGAGVMRLEDYKSIQNVSMDTQEFRQKCLDAAVALGTLTKQGEKYISTVGETSEAFDINQFADHLTKGRWLTSDVMMKVFNEYSGAVDQLYEYTQENGGTASEAIEALGDNVDAFGLKAFRAAQEARSFRDVIDSVKDAVSTGWMNTFQLLLGNYEEQRVLWTDLANAMYDVFAEGGNERNEMLEAWAELGGREQLIASFWNVWRGLVSTIDLFKESFRDIFPKKTANDLFNFVRKLCSITSQLSFNAQIAVTSGLTDKVSRSLKGLFALLNIGKQAVSAFSSALRPVKQALWVVVQQILDVTAVAGDMLVRFNNIIARDKYLERFAKTVAGWLKSGLQHVTAFTGGVRDALLGLVRHMNEAFNKARSFIRGFTGDYRKAVDTSIMTSGVAAVNEISELGERVRTHLTDIRNTFREVFPDGFLSGLAAQFVKMKDTLGELFGKAKEKILPSGMISIASVLDSIAEAVKSAIRWLGEMRTALSDASRESQKSADYSILTKALLALGSAFKFAAGVIGSAVKAIAGHFDSLSFSIDKTGFVSFFEKLGMILKAAAGVIGRGVKAILSYIGALFDGMNAADIASFLKDLSITSLLASLTKIFFNAGKISKRIAETFESIGDAFEALQWRLKADILKQLAIAIGIITASIIALSFVDTEKIIAAGGAIAVLVAELVASLALLPKGGKVTASFGTLIGVAASALILAIAVKKLADIPEDALTQGVITIGALITGVWMFLMSIQKIDGTKIAGLAATVIAMGVAVSTIAKAIKKHVVPAIKTLGEMDADQLYRGSGAFAVIAVVMIGLMASLGAFSKKTKVVDGDSTSLAESKVKDMAISLLGIVVAVKMAAGVIKELGAIDPDQLIQGGIALTLITVGIVALMGALSYFSEETKVIHGGGRSDATSHKIAEMAVSILGIVVAVKLLLPAIEQLGSMDTGKLIQGGAALAGIAGGLVLFMAAMSKISGTGNAGGMAVVAASLLILTAAINSLVPALLIMGTCWQQTLIGLGLLAGAFAVLGAAGLLLTPVAPTIFTLAKSIEYLGIGIAAIGVGLTLIGPGLISLAAGITTLSAAICAESALITTAIKIIGNAIVDIVVSVASALVAGVGSLIVAVCKAIQVAVPELINTVRIVLQAVLNVVRTLAEPLIDTLLFVLVTLFEGLETYTPRLLDALFGFLTALWEGLEKHIPAMVKRILKTLGDLFSELITALGQLDFNTIITAVAGIGAVSAFLIAMKALGPLATGAIVGVVKVTAFLAVAADCLAVIGMLYEIPHFADFMRNGAEIFTILGSAIGGFVGGIVGGVVAGATAGLPMMGEHLSQFMRNADYFLQNAYMFDSGAIDGIASLAKLVLALTAADILKGLTSWLTGGSSFVSFGKELEKFGPHFAKYYDSVKSVKSDAIEGSTNAAKALASMATSLPNSGGVVSWFSGDNSLVKFGEELEKFGPHFKNYAKSVEGLKADVVVNSVNAGKAVAELAKGLPNSGGLLAKIVGDNHELSKFGEELEAFGPHLKAYAKNVEGLNADVVVNSANAGKAVAELAKGLPNSGGLLAKIIGDNSLTSFAEGLTVFGTSFAEYSVLMSGIDNDILTTTISASKSIMTIQDTLPKSGGWLSGTMTLDSFGKDLAAFGEFLKKYYDSLDLVKMETLDAATVEIKGIVEIAKGLDKVNFSQMKQFGESLKKIGADGIKKFTDTFKDASDKAKTAAKDFLDAFIKGADNKKSDITSAFSKIISAITDTFAKKKSDFETTGKNLVTYVQNGATGKTADIKKGFGKIIDAVLSEIRGRYSDFQNAGSYIAQGLEKGMSSSTDGVLDSAKNIPNSMISTIKGVLKINSPSKVMEQLGMYTGEGFMRGLDGYDGEVYAAGASIGDSTILGMQYALSKVVDIMENGMDAEPIIRPVLDLTDIQNGTARISDMMGSLGGYSIGGSVRLANAAAYGIEQNLMARGKMDIQVSGDSDGGAGRSTVIENTFHITGTGDPRETANEIARIIQKQIERRDALWD